MTSRDDGKDYARLLWDIEQIKQLKARYFRFLDAKDWGAFADLFTEDCVHHLSVEAPKPMVMNAEYLSDLKKVLGNLVTTHVGHMPEITLLSDIEAEGIWSMFDFLETLPVDGSKRQIKGYGHYYETYRKCDDGQWRISSKRNVRQRLDNAPRTSSAG